MFEKWCKDSLHEPYISYGNGSALRIYPVSWIANSEDEAKLLSNVISGGDL